MEGPGRTEGQSNWLGALSAIRDFEKGYLEKKVDKQHPVLEAGKNDYTFKWIKKPSFFQKVINRVKVFFGVKNSLSGASLDEKGGLFGLKDVFQVKLKNERQKFLLEKSKFS